MTTQSFIPSVHQSFSPSIPYIMDCNPAEFKSILLKYMQKFDDYQQTATDQEKPAETLQYFVDAYNQLDSIYTICFRHNTTSSSSLAVRNQARLIIKHAERLAITELETCNP